MSTFILTVNPERLAGWDDYEWDAMIAAGQWPRLLTGWSTGTRHSGIEPGDDLLFLRQGSDLRGLIAHMVARSTIYQGPHWSVPGKLANYVDLEVMSAVPTDDRIPTDVLQQVAPQVQWRYLMGSGVQIPDSVEDDVMDAILYEWLDRDLLVAIPDEQELATLPAIPLVLAAHALGLDKEVADRAEMENWIRQHLKQSADRNHQPVDRSDDEESDQDRTLHHRIDSLRKAAVERYAMQEAQLWLERQGYTVTDVSATQCWDLSATRDGSSIPVEVKGSTGTRPTIDVTANEVGHAHQESTLLVVVDEIDCNQDKANHCTKGRLRTWWPWNPDQLTPTAYRCTLHEDDTAAVDPAA